MQDAFSLLAYSDPWNCPVGQQLDPTQRESLCSALNSAILGKEHTDGRILCDTDTSRQHTCLHFHCVDAAVVLVSDVIETRVLCPCPIVFFSFSPESQNLPKQPPLMLALGQATECVQLMARVRSGSCSFARVDNFLH